VSLFRTFVIVLYICCC